MDKSNPQVADRKHCVASDQAGIDASAANSGRRSPRRFYMAMGIVALLVTAAGFGGSIFSMVSGAKLQTPLVHVHAAVFLGWLVLYIVQTSLVGSGRTSLHKRLGIGGVVLALAVVGVGWQTAIAAARRGFDLPLDNSHDPLRFLLFTLGDLLSFTVLVAGALWFRQRPEVHKRLMLLTTVGPMMSASLVHLWVQLPVVPARTPLFLASMIALLFAGALHDRLSRGRFHPVSLWGAVALFVWGNLRALVIGPSDTWHQVAAWLIQ